jgi:hypothetical protein
MMAPCGIELRIGQVWRQCEDWTTTAQRERDGRFTRLITVLNWDEDTESVTIGSGRRKSTAALRRFSGKAGGYEWKRNPIRSEAGSQNPKAPQ